LVSRSTHAIDRTVRNPQSHRYHPDAKAAAAGRVMTLRPELGTRYGIFKRVAEQFCYGDEMVRS
jgi:hypothetical protein